MVPGSTSSGPRTARRSTSGRGCSLKISDASFEYLYNQRGELQKFDDREKWYRAFQLELIKTMDHVYDNIGGPPSYVLDIGSGLGAIDAVMIREFGCHVTMVDGEDGGPVSVRHNEPFCSRDAVERFMDENSISSKDYMYCAPRHIGEPMFFNLVVSFRAWCFHFPPEYYLRLVRDSCPPGARIIVDMRREHADWRAHMRECFYEVAVIEQQDKFERVVFEVHGDPQ